MDNYKIFNRLDSKILFSIYTTTIIQIGYLQPVDKLWKEGVL